MLKELFNIEPASAGDAGEQVLSLRIGERHCGYAITDKSGDLLYKLGYFALDGMEGNPVADLFAAHPELNESFYKVLAGYDYPQSTLVPSQQYKEGDAGLLLKTLYGINGTATVISEAIPAWEVYNIYGVPKELHEWMNKKFHAGHYWHQYTLGIKLMRGDAAGHILVDMRAEDFMVIAGANNKLLLAQTFQYSTPEDVLYYLLKICQQFGLSQQDVHLSLSGLIDKQSALFKELYQYFINIEFRQPGWVNSGNEYPAHFFTSLNDLARCAS